VYKLRAGEKIDLDGRLDESAWNVTPMSDLVDLGGGSPPYRKTHVVMRYDQEYLYVGAILEEPQVWANHTEENTKIYMDNDFEIFVDPGAEYNFYKELEIGALNVRWNLLLTKPYMDGGEAVCNSTEDCCVRTDPTHGITKVFDIRNTWKTAVYVDGKVNDPVTGSKLWSLEMMVPIKDMLLYSNGEFPKHNVFWGFNVLRVEWPVTVEPKPTPHYVKVGEYNCHNWAWAPTNDTTVHIPDKWGFLQFSEGPVNTTKLLANPSFPLRKLLVGVFTAEQSYNATHLKYTSNLEDLSNLDRSLLKCVRSVSISSDKLTFTVTAESVDGSILGTITEERKVTIKKNS